MGLVYTTSHDCQEMQSGEKVKSLLIRYHSTYLVSVVILYDPMYLHDCGGPGS